MYLYLMRHARPEEKDPGLYPDDSKRPLSERGIKEHTRFMQDIKDSFRELDAVLSSPFLRARQTAEISAEELGFDGKVRVVEELGKTFSVVGVLCLLSEYDEDSAVLCVGHAPDMEQLAASLLHESGEVFIKFKKGAVMCLAFDGPPSTGHGELQFFHRPGE